MCKHDIGSFADGLGAKLSARSRHVCAFLGAGTSTACGLPDVAALQTRVAEKLDEANREAFEGQLSGRNLEQALSRVRRIETLLKGGSGQVDGLDADAAADLDKEICQVVVESLSVDDADLGPAVRFATWAAQADYGEPLELFTVNYDLILETALEQLAVPYFDGFVGTLRARFRTDLVDAPSDDPRALLPSFVVRLWKLHGSVSWEWEAGERPEIVRLGLAVPTGHPAAIYPSDAKYDESRRVPFVVLQDRFRKSLQTPETLVLVTGYSWSDGHLNEMLFDAAKHRPRTEFVAFSYGDLPNQLAEQAVALPNIQAVGDREAVLGGVRAEWAEPEGGDIPDVWSDGACRLGDFRHLAAFLARSAPPHGDLERRATEFLATLNADA